MSTINVTAIEEFSKIRVLAEEGDLWIINNTSLNNKRPRGVMALSIKDSNGDVIPLVIPATWIPINLATMCDPTYCVASQSFRDAVGKRNLLVITANEAKNILSSDDAKREAKAVEEYRLGNSAATNSANYTSGESTVTVQTSKDSSSLKTVSQFAVSDSVQNINEDDNVLHKLVVDFNAGLLSDEQVEDAYRTIKPSVEALKTAGSNVNNTGSKFFEMIADSISESA